MKPHDPKLRAKALAMYEADVPHKTIQERTGLCPTLVREWAKAEGIQPRRPTHRAYSKAVQDKAMAMFAGERSAPAVAAEIGCCSRTVLNWARARGVRPGPRRHQRWHDDQTRARAVKLYRTDMPMAKISAALGVDRHTITDWAREAGVPPRRGNHLANRNRDR